MAVIISNSDFILPPPWKIILLFTLCCFCVLKHMFFSIFLTCDKTSQMDEGLDGEVWYSLFIKNLAYYNIIHLIKILGYSLK